VLKNKSKRFIKTFGNDKKDLLYLHPAREEVH
jgi:hypothetical protein